jgi:N,N'-diacetylbacillosaminyl-diphospho-undecaprenol alpha-1,3-N-acetylgalactosaminyltransferase
MELKTSRLAFISNSAKGEYTGRVPWVRHLNKAGFDISFVLPSEEYLYVEKIRQEGIEVKLWSLKRGRLNLTNKVFSIIQLTLILRKARFDIIHSFGHEANIFCAIAGRIAGTKRIIAHVTGLGSEFIEGPSIIGRTAILLYWLTRRSVTHYVFENENDLMYFRHVHKGKALIIPSSGIDTSYFDPLDVDEARIHKLRKEIDLEEDDIVVTFIGRLLIHKGLKELLATAQLIAEKYSNMKFLIIGELDESNPSSISKKDIDDFRKIRNVYFMDRRDEIKEILQITDIFVNPSYREGLPRATLEAMAMNKAIVTSDVPGCRETVDHGVNGLLVPPRDAEALSEALTQLADDKALRENMGVASRRLILNKYTIEHIVARSKSELYCDFTDDEE